jgi:hypothetical protein
VSPIPILLRRAGGGASVGNKGELGQEQEAGAAAMASEELLHKVCREDMLLISSSVPLFVAFLICMLLLVCSFLDEDLIISFVILLSGALLIVDTSTRACSSRKTCWYLHSY